MSAMISTKKNFRKYIFCSIFLYLYFVDIKQSEVDNKTNKNNSVTEIISRKVEIEPNNVEIKILLD